MIIPAILIQKYESYRHTIEEVANRVKSTLQNYCEKNGYAFISRIKTMESLAEKIETGRLKNWSEINDLFACTIIIPNLSHEEKVSAFCSSIFNIQSMRGPSTTQKAPDVFRFDALRIYAQLPKPDGLDMPEQFGIYDVIFEIQVKTAFEHAWSVSTHDLVYKGPDIDWQRQRLAAQIKATVEQLDTLILAFEPALKHISESPHDDTSERKKISARIKSFAENGHIPSECLPKDLARFCNNFYELLRNTKNGKNVDIVLATVESELSNTPGELFPRSVSLLQYFLAILVKQKMIALPIAKHWCHISEELLQICPELRKKSLSFDYEMTDQLRSDPNIASLPRLETDNVELEQEPPTP